jgi:hypothetical protein
MMQRFARSLLGPFYKPIRMRLESIADGNARTAMLMGQLFAEAIRQRGTLSRLNDAEFRVFSQFGEDGIIQYLTSSVPITDRTFVEFGVDDYQESNTRFLLLVDKWRGLVIEGNAAQVEEIRRNHPSWRTRLTALSSFVTRENINDLISQNGVGADIGLFSIDIDGNDYWVWEALTATRARILVCEFNPLFGCELAVTIPYDPAFVFGAAHPSRMYFGASLAALATLAEKKGYSLVGCTSEGVNAFFVRNDVLGALAPVTPRECFAAMTPPRLGGDANDIAVIGHLPLVNVVSGETKPISAALESMRARPAPLGKTSSSPRAVDRRAGTARN